MSVKTQSTGLAGLLESVVFGQRALVLIVFAVATLVLGYFATQLRVDAGFAKQLPLKHEYIQTFVEYQENFGGANRILVSVIASDGDMFDAEFFKVMERVTEEVKVIDGVNPGTLRSIFTPNVRFVEIVEGGFAGGNVIPARFTPSDPNFAPTTDDFENIRSNIVKAGIVGRLVAKDFSGAMVIAELIPEAAAPGGKLDYQKIAAELEAIRSRYETADSGVTLNIIGFAKIVGDITEGAKSVVMFFGVAIALTFFLLLFYSRSLKLAGWTILVALISVVWMLGVLRLLGFGIDPMNILTPFLIFAVAVSHGVQMTSSWISERFFSGEDDGTKLAAAPETDPETAARRTFGRLLVPGAIALLSDCIGFVTILLIDIQIIRELAITASIGVALIMLTNLVMHPLLLSYTRIGNAAAYRVDRIRSATSRDWFWNALSLFARPVPAIIAVVIGAGLAWYGHDRGQGIQIGDSEAGVPELRPQARFNQDAKVISDRFSLGLDMVSVIAVTDPQACTDSYEAMELVDRFAWHMQNVDGVQQVVTLPQVSKVINAGWNEGNIRWRVLPRNKYVQRQNLQNIETDTGLLNNQCSAIPVQITLVDHKATTINRLVAAVKDFRENNNAYEIDFLPDVAALEAAEAAGETFTPRPDANLRLATGSAGIMAATNDVVAAAQLPMLMWVYAAVVLLCLLTYRSVVATIAIVVPLVVVSLLANALMVYLNIGLKVNTLPVAALGVGIGVDYAIYIYSRMREFLDRGYTLTEAYFHALKLSGRAVLFTGITLSIGVATWIFSDLKFQADMGVLLAFFFLMNMVGAVILMPALLRVLGKPAGD